MIRLFTSFLLLTQFNNINSQELKTADTTQPLKIISGTPAKDNYPGIAAIQNNENFTFCGGSLISPTSLLTAAHCLHNMKPDQLKIIFNTTDLSSTQSNNVVGAEQILFHPSFIYNDLGNNNVQIHNDLAIIKLNKIVSVPIMWLDPDNYGNVERAKATVLGYGVTSPNNTSASKTLQEASLMIANPKICRDIYDDDFDEKILICTEAPPDNPNSSTCNGDSGSPLIVQDAVVGVVSYGSIHCNDAVSVFTKVSAYMDWILKNL